MDIRQMQYFVTIVQEGSISAAARKLYMSQPPLSMQLKLLEEEFGCELLARGARQVQLTEAGKTLYSYAVNMLELSRIAKEEVRYTASHGNGTLRIGVVSSVACGLGAELIASYQKEYPGIQFEITEANTYELLDGLRSDKLQLAIVRTPFPAEGFSCTELGADSIVAYGKKGWLTGENCSIRELAMCPLVVYRRWEAVLAEAFSRHGKVLKPGTLCDDGRTAVRLAEEGAGIGLVPQSVLPEMIPDTMQVSCIREEKLSSQIQLICRSGGYQPTCAREFVEFANMHFASDEN